MHELKHENNELLCSLTGRYWPVKEHYHSWGGVKSSVYCGRAHDPPGRVMAGTQGSEKGGAGDGNRTHVTSLEGCTLTGSKFRLNQYIIDIIDFSVLQEFCPAGQVVWKVVFFALTVPFQLHIVSL